MATVHFFMTCGFTTKLGQCAQEYTPQMMDFSRVPECMDLSHPTGHLVMQRLRLVNVTTWRTNISNVDDIAMVPWIVGLNNRWVGRQGAAGRREGGG